MKATRGNRQIRAYVVCAPLESTLRTLSHYASRISPHALGQHQQVAVQTDPACKLQHTEAVACKSCNSCISKQSTSSPSAYAQTLCSATRESPVTGELELRIHILHVLHDQTCRGQSGCGLSATTIPSIRRGHAAESGCAGSAGHHSRNSSFSRRLQQSGACNGKRHAHADNCRASAARALCHLFFEKKAASSATPGHVPHMPQYRLYVQA